MSSEVYTSVESYSYVYDDSDISYEIIPGEYTREEIIQQELESQVSETKERIKERFDAIRKQISEILSITSDKDVTAAVKIENIVNYDTNEKYTSGRVAFDTANEAWEKDGDIQKTVHKASDLADQLETYELNSSEGALKNAYIKLLYSKLRKLIELSIVKQEKVTKFADFVNRLLQDKKINFKDFKLQVDRRFTSLFSGLTQMENALTDPDQDLCEYYALCELLGAASPEIDSYGTSPIKLQNCCDEMKKQLHKKKTEESFYQNLKEVFAELGMFIQGEMVLDGVCGKKVTADGIEGCSVFMAPAGDGIVFETVAEIPEKKSVSLNQKRLIIEKADKICRKHEEIYRRMKKRGFLLNMNIIERPDFNKMHKIVVNSAERQIERETDKELFVGGN